MTDRFAGFIITLESDMREDDAQATISAIRQIKHVISVDPVRGDFNLAIAEQRARLELSSRLYEVLADPQ